MATINDLQLKYKSDLEKLKNNYNNSLLLYKQKKIDVTDIRIIFNNYKKDQIALKIKLDNDIISINKIVTPPIVTPPIVVQPIVTQPLIINNKKALLIGINYRNTRNELYGCINDVYSIEKQLKTVYGFSNITILTDDTNIKPTRNNIFNQIQSLLQNSKSGDILFVSYSGHGISRMDTNNDETDDHDELLYCLDGNVIIDDDLKTLINTYLKKDVYFVMLCDSCYSGTILDLKYVYLDTQSGGTDTINNKTNDTFGNVILISGSQDNQTAADVYINKIPQGATTWAFLTALTTNSKPSWKNLLLEMRRLTKQNGYSQIPQLSSGKYIDINNTIWL